MLILETGTITTSIHCMRVRMPERGVSRNDLITALDNGWIIQEAEWDEEYQDWKYRVEGFDTFGDELTVMSVIIDEHNRIFVITIF